MFIVENVKKTKTKLKITYFPTLWEQWGQLIINY